MFSALRCEPPSGAIWGPPYPLSCLRHKGIEITILSWSNVHCIKAASPQHAGEQLYISTVCSMCPVLGHWTAPVQSLGWPPWTLVTPSNTCAGLLLGGGRCFKPKTSGKTVLSYHTMKYKFNCISLVKFINFRVWYDNNEDFHAWGAVRFFFFAVV